MMHFGVRAALWRAYGWGLGLGLAGLFGSHFTSAAGTVTLAWDRSTDPTAAGYNVYYGAASRTYTNVVNATTNTSLSIPGLVAGATYYFAATTYNLAGLESDYSTEVFYTVPSPVINVPPTLNQPANLTVNENSGPQTVTLTGISSGSPTENQTLSISALSSNTRIIPAPAVNYTNPNAAAVLTLAPVGGSYGSATITVMVDDGGAVSNTVIRSFTVTVLPVNNPPTLDPIGAMTIQENDGAQSVNLTGITAGSGESQRLSLSAVSSNPGLVPNPTVQYVSPNSTALLVFTPVTNAYGWAQLTVTVDDGQPTNNLFTQSFIVTVLQQADTGGTNTVGSKSWSMWWKRTDGLTMTWQMDGTNKVSGSILNVEPVDSSWMFAAQADFNGDGKTDLVWQRTNQVVKIWLMDGTNCLSRVKVAAKPMPEGWRIRAAGDVDGDGMPDLLWQSPEGKVTAWLMNGTNYVRRAPFNAPPAGSNWRLAACGHFGGSTDLLWQNPNGATLVWLMDGTNCTSHFRLNAPLAGSTWKIVGTADLTGLRHSDIIWEERTTGVLAYWMMDGVDRVGVGNLNPSQVNPLWRAMGPR
jgi:hypothetical protein